MESGAIDNVAIGQQALKVNLGRSNVAVGGRAGLACTDGFTNVMVGEIAGADVTTGDNNILIGNEAGRTGSPGGSITTANNILSLGDGNIATAKAAEDLIKAGDKRDKTDVEPVKMGLDFVNKLEPVTYQWEKSSM